MDGLVTNASLIIGVGGGGASPHAIILTGLAGLAAGSLSMAAGEYISVRSQNELTHAEAALEKTKLAEFPEAEHEELVEVLMRYGLDRELAERAATGIARDPDAALRMHTREELGVDPHNLPSPWTAGGASLASFAVGAVLPLLPFFVGSHSLLLSLLITAAALFVGGAVVGRLTGRSLLRSGGRQLILGVLAAAVTFGIGRMLGAGAA